MAESALRKQKKQAQAAAWRKLTPEQRIQRAAALTASALQLRAAGSAARKKG